MANKKANTTSTSANTVEVEVNETSKEKAKTKKVSPLNENTEIEVEALIPNVSYFDKKTGDTYVWENAGDVELLTVETLKSMFRNYRSYFNNLWLKPLDDRIIKQYKLEKLYQRYDKILDAKNYNFDTIDEVIETISNLPNSVKFAMFQKLQNWVANGDISNVKLVKKLERKFGLDLIELI